MKNFSVLLFLFFQVPNTTTFTLQDVKTEIESKGGPIILSLQDAFNAVNPMDFADAGGGETYYSLYGNSLKAFRNYTHPLPITISVSPIAALFRENGGTKTFTITTSAGNSWTILRPKLLWLTVSPSSGSGSGTFTCTASANSGLDRSVILTIYSANGSATVTIEQMEGGFIRI